MSGPIPQHSTRAWTGALLTLGAYLSLATGESLAGTCQHQTTPNGITQADANAFTQLAQAGALPTTDGLPTPPGKCSGSACSDHPSAPLATKPVVPLRANEFGVARLFLPPKSLPPAFESGPEATVRPVRNVADIFHPPRSLSA